jgi:hypothetical protein
MNNPKQKCRPAKGINTTLYYKYIWKYILSLGDKILRKIMSGLLTSHHVKREIKKECVINSLHVISAYGHYKGIRD